VAARPLAPRPSTDVANLSTGEFPAEFPTDEMRQWLPFRHAVLTLARG